MPPAISRRPARRREMSGIGRCGRELENIRSGGPDVSSHSDRSEELSAGRPDSTPERAVASLARMISPADTIRRLYRDDGNTRASSRTGWRYPLRFAPPLRSLPARSDLQLCQWTSCLKLLAA